MCHAAQEPDEDTSGLMTDVDFDEDGAEPAEAGPEEPRSSPEAGISFKFQK